MDQNTHTSEQTICLHAEPAKQAPVVKLPEWMQKGIDRHKRESQYRGSQASVRHDLSVTYEGSVGAVG
ncbi:MAG TPA: hypothetical protein PLB51_00330 [Candidatus Paceibacterota bacterium]|jgi:hypothetical protein|nr:hypothetical protein [Candidatus Paceibacterota bacterium]